MNCLFLLIQNSIRQYGNKVKELLIKIDDLLDRAHHQDQPLTNFAQPRSTTCCTSTIPLHQLYPTVAISMRPHLSILSILAIAPRISHRLPLHLKTRFRPAKTPYNGILHKANSNVNSIFAFFYHFFPIFYIDPPVLLTIIS